MPRISRDDLIRPGEVSKSRLIPVAPPSLEIPSLEAKRDENCDRLRPEKQPDMTRRMKQGELQDTWRTDIVIPKVGFEIKIYGKPYVFKEGDYLTIAGSDYTAVDLRFHSMRQNPEVPPRTQIWALKGIPQHMQDSHGRPHFADLYKEILDGADFRNPKIDLYLQIASRQEGRDTMRIGALKQLQTLLIATVPDGTPGLTSKHYQSLVLLQNSETPAVAQAAKSLYETIQNRKWFDTTQL